MKEQFIVDMLTTDLDKPFSQIADRLAPRYGYVNGASATGSLRSETIRNPKAIAKVISTLIQKKTPFRVNATISKLMQDMNLRASVENEPDPVTSLEQETYTIVEDESTPEEKVMEEVGNVMHSLSKIQGLNIEEFLKALNSSLVQATQSMEVSRFTDEIQRLRSELSTLREYADRQNKEIEELRRTPVAPNEQYQEMLAKLKEIRRNVSQYKGLSLDEKMRNSAQLIRTVLASTNDIHTYET